MTCVELPYTLAPMLGHYLPLRSRKRSAAAAAYAHARGSQSPCRVDPRSLSCRARLREQGTQSGNTQRGCSALPEGY